MRRLFDSLGEKDRRRYAAIEATKLGHGGIEYVAGLLGCDPKTIRQGQCGIGGNGRSGHRSRPKKRGGRKRLIEISAALEENFFKVLADHTAGDPMRANVKWTNLSRRQIAERISALGTPVGRDVVSQLLRKHGFRRRKALKKKTMGHHRDRNAQFENIARLKKEYLKAGSTRHQHRYEEEGIAGQFPPRRQDRYAGDDRDQRPRLRQRGLGRGDPPRHLRCGRNQGFIHLNTSHDTSELACDSIAAWWEKHGRAGYPLAEETARVVRRRRQQQRDEVRVQGGTSETGEPAGHRNS